MKIFQTTSTQIPPPQIDLAQVFFVYGSIAGIIALIITGFKFYYDYMKGSDIRLIKERKYDIDANFIASITMGVGDWSATAYYTKFDIPLILANYGNKSGVVTSFKLGNETPEGITGEKQKQTTPDTIPITIDARDSVGLNYEIIWNLDLKLQEDVIKGNERIVEITKTIEWSKTVHKGKLRQKIEVKQEHSEIRIVCRMIYQSK